MPQDAIVVDEAITAAGGFWEHSATAAGHDVLAVTGGSIGIGLPLAVGAAVACPDRRVVALQADGSAMYTIQSLWCGIPTLLLMKVYTENLRHRAVLTTEG